MNETRNLSAAAAPSNWPIGSQS